MNPTFSHSREDSPLTPCDLCKALMQLRDLKIKASLPLHVKTTSNTGGHWSKKARQAKMERSTIASFLRCQKLPKIHITFTRIAPRLLDSDDNLPSAFKHIRDGVADALGVDDKSSIYVWKYEQRKGKPSSISVFIEII